MIDIHTHMLPGADDGSPDMEESIKMARMAADSGVKALAVTPHCNIPGMFGNYKGERLEKRLLELRREVEELHIPVQLYGGAEVFATPELPELLEEDQVLTLNDTRYFLVEFAFDENPDWCSHILGACSRRGFLPIIAHPERYYALWDYPEIAAGWLRQGYGVQLNKGSILGRFGRQVERTARELLNRRLVSCVASDAHSAYRRTPHLGQVQEFLQMEYGSAYAKRLLSENPRRILEGKELL